MYVNYVLSRIIARGRLKGNDGINMKKSYNHPFKFCHILFLGLLIWHFGSLKSRLFVRVGQSEATLYWNLHKVFDLLCCIPLTNSCTFDSISDLDEKMEAMMIILEDGNYLDQGADMHCKWREDLIRMLEDFGQSYRVLALAYNQLRSKTSHNTFHPGSFSSSSTSKILCADCNKRATGNLEDKKLKEGCNGHPKSLMEGSDIKFDGTNLDFGQINKKEEYHELLSADPCSMKFKPELEYRDNQMEDRMTEFSTNENVFMKIEGLELNQRTEDPSIINYKFDNMWSTLKFQITKLTEDNLQQLVELVRRNDEKRETIKRLQSEMEALKLENRALQISLRYSNADSECDQPRISRPGGISMGKLFRGCSP